VGVKAVVLQMLGKKAIKAPRNGSATNIEALKRDGQNS
jgi:hypothetical protein